MTDKTDGQIAYEAAAKLTKCDQPWSGANQRKWEDAAKAVKKQFVEQACEAVYKASFKHGEITDNGVIIIPEERIIEAIKDKFK